MRYDRINMIDSCTIKRGCVEKVGTTDGLPLWRGQCAGHFKFNQKCFSSLGAQSFVLGTVHPVGADSPPGLKRSTLTTFIALVAVKFE